MNGYIRILADRHVSPPVPGRYTHTLRDIVDAVDSSACVASGNDKAWLFLIGHGEDIAFPLAFEVGFLDNALFDEFLDEWTLAIGAYDDLRATNIFCREGRAASRHPFGISLQIAYGSFHLKGFLLVVFDGRIFNTEDVSPHRHNGQHHQYEKQKFLHRFSYLLQKYAFLLEKPMIKCIIKCVKMFLCLFSAFFLDNKSSVNQFFFLPLHGLNYLNQ